MAEDIILRTAAFGGFNKSDVLKYVERLKAAEAELKSEKKSALLKADESEKEITELKLALKEKEREFEEQLAALNEEHKNELEAVRTEYEQKLSECISSERSPQEVVGTAMLDVRRYADLLIQETCTKIDKMSDDADMAAAKTLSRILDVTSGIQAFSDKLNSVIADMIKENEEICKELTGFKSSLRIPFEAASGKIHSEILGE